MTTENTAALLSASADLVAQAEAHLAERRSAMTSAMKEYGAIRARIDAIEAQRREIAARRARGAVRDSDSGDVTLLDMDAKALAAPLAKADAALEELRARLAEAERRFAHAKSEMAKAEGRAALDALLRHAGAVCDTLTATLAEVAKAGERVGALNYRWTPPADLMQRLRRCELAGRPV